MLDRDPGDPGSPLVTAQYSHRHLDVACSLDGTQTGARLAEWRALRDSFGLGAEPIPMGVRLRLRSGAWEIVNDLAQREAACCGFLDFGLVGDDRGIHLDITSSAHGSAGVIAELTGLDDGVSSAPPGGRNGARAPRGQTLPD